MTLQLKCLMSWTEFWKVHLLMTEFGCPELTLCGWQHVKKHFRTNARSVKVMSELKENTDWCRIIQSRSLCLSLSHTHIYAQRWPCVVDRALKNIFELIAPSTTTPFWKCSQGPKAVVERDQTPFNGARVTERRFKGLHFKGRHVNPVQQKILVNTPTWACGPPLRTDVQFIVVVWHGTDKYLFVAVGVGKVRSEVRVFKKNYSPTLSGFKT